MTRLFKVGLMTTMIVSVIGGISYAGRKINIRAYVEMKTAKGEYVPVENANVCARALAYDDFIVGLYYISKDCGKTGKVTYNPPAVSGGWVDLKVTEPIEGEPIKINADYQGRKGEEEIVSHEWAGSYSVTVLIE